MEYSYEFRFTTQQISLVSSYPPMLPFPRRPFSQSFERRLGMPGRQPSPISNPGWPDAYQILLKRMCRFRCFISGLCCKDVNDMMIIVDDVYIHTDSGLWLCDVYVHIINSMDLDFSIGIFDGSLHPSLWKRERLEANLICCEFRARSSWTSTCGCSHFSAWVSSIRFSFVDLNTLREANIAIENGPFETLWRCIDYCNGDFLLLC